jgi:hypothetical protein
MKLKSTICIRLDDAVMLPLYRHLAALPVKPGKPYRARVLCALLEVGSIIVFAPGDPLADAVVRAARSIAIETSEVQTDSKPIRVDLVLPDTPAMRPLRQRLTDLPGGPGAQARSRLVLLALQAAVNLVYRDLPLPVSGGANVGSGAAPSSADAPADQSAPAASAALRPDMTDFMDNLSMEGL